MMKNMGGADGSGGAEENDSDDDEMPSLEEVKE